MATATVKNTETRYGSQNAAGNDFTYINYSDLYVGHPPNDGDSAGYVARIKFPSISYASAVTLFRLLLYFKEGFTSSYQVYVSSNANLTPYQVTHGSATLLTSSRGITPADGGAVTAGKFYYMDLAPYIDAINAFAGTWYLYLYKPAQAAGRSVFQGGAGSNGAYLDITYTSYTACGAPTGASLAASVSEGEVTVNFSGATAGTANAITGYRFEYQESDNGATWPSAWTFLKNISTSSGSGSTTLAVHGTCGKYRRYQMLTMGAAGADYYSAYKAISGVVRKNQLPGVLTFTAPVNATAIFNTKPYIVATIGAEPDGQTQKLQISIDGGAFADFATGISASGGAIKSALDSALSAGTHTIALRVVDALGAIGTAVSRTISVASAAWTRPFVSGVTLLSGSGVNHVPDVVQLWDRVNLVRAYYGLTAIALPETLGPTLNLADWLPMMQAMQAGLGACYAATGRTVPSWISPARNFPRADIINQIRDAVAAA